MKDLEKLPHAAERARAYLARVPSAIETCGGGAHTFKLCCQFWRKFGASELDQGELFDLIVEWNEFCQPPWPVTELRRIYRNALKTVGTPEAWSNTPVAERIPWPNMRKGTPGELRRLSELRGFSTSGLLLASKLGFLRFARWQDKLCWIVTNPDSDACQARRLDGGQFQGKGEP